MIDIEKYKVILDEGLLLDHYALLSNIRDGKELIKSKRIEGFINLMAKKGYIENGVLTEKALVILDGSLEGAKPIRFELGAVPIQPKKEERFDYAAWVIGLHKKCENKIYAATGKRQMRPKVEGSTYSFLPNPTDLGKVILRLIHIYKLKDRDLPKVESTILRYVNRCIKDNSWTPLLGYYIMKNGTSSMMTDMDEDEGDEITDNPTIHIV